MPEETTGDELTQEEKAQEDPGDTQDDAFVEGFESPSKDEEDVEDDTGKESEDSPTDQEEKKVEEPSIDYYKGELEAVRKHNSDLNKALFQERQKIKEVKAEDENPLNDAQIKQLMIAHKDDPDTLYNVINYAIRKGVKEQGKELLDSEKLNTQRTVASQYVSSNFPQLNDPTNPDRQKLDTIKHELGLEDHPWGDVAGLGLMFMSNMPQLMPQIEEAVKQKVLKEKANATRKAGVKATQLADSGKKKAVAHKSGLTASQLETAKQLGFNTAEELSTYARLVRKPQATEAM